MHKHLKVRSLILVALIVASFFTVTFLPATTLAVDNQKSPSENARALAYFYTLRRCMAETFSGALPTLTAEQINNFSWLSGYKLPLGAQFITNDGDWDGNVNCDGGGTYGSWRQDAVKALGYANNRDLLCNVMNPYQSVSPELDGERSAVETLYKECSKGQGNLDVKSLITAKDTSASFGGLINKNDSTLSSMFNQSVGQQFFADTEPISSKDVELPLQELFYTTFQKFCQPSDYNGGTVGSDLRKESIKRFDRDSSSYTSVDVLVKADRINKTTDVIAHNILPSGEPNKTLDSSTMSCRQIIDKANGYADKAQAIYDALPQDSKDEIKTNLNTGNTSVGTDANNSTSCTIDGLGWIVCPVMNFMGGIIDGAYGVISAMLTTSPSMFDTSKSEGQVTQAAWSVMRNIANVAFVIVFLIIIFSQLSSIGITNYGIKKMLPKLIVAAVLVNISFYLCAAAVDLSNVLGHSLKDLMDSISNSIVLNRTDTEWDAAWNGGNVWMHAIGGLIASAAITAGALYAGLSVLLPLLIAALAAIVTVVVVLTMRQALIVLLIVISPLAFIALLLPNTEGLFKKWRGLLMTLLLMYPAIALIFGASALAGKIIMGSSTNILIQIMGAGVTIIPLFITPVVMKTAGGVLNRFAGVVNNPNKGVFDRMRKGAEGVRKRQEGRREIRALNNGKVFGGGRFRRAARSSAITKGIEGEVARAQAGYVADEAQSVDAFRNQLAGGKRFGPGRTADPEAVQRALANAINVQAKLEADEVNAAKAILQTLNLDNTQRAALEQGGAIGVGGKTFQGGSLQKAALSNAVAEQRMSDVEAAAKSVTGDAAKHLSKEISANYAGTKSKAVHLVDDMNLKKLAGGNALNPNDIESASARSLAGMSAALMSTQKEASLALMETVKGNMAAGATYAQKIDPATGATVYVNNTVSQTNIKAAAMDLQSDTEKFNNLGVDGKTSVNNLAL